MPTPEEITRHEYDEPSGGRSAWVGDARPEAGISVVEPDPAWPWTFGVVEERIRAALGEPHANLHVFGPDSPEPVRHRIFRDWLIGHPADRDRYRDAKLGAAAEANAAGEHVMDYNARKEPVIRAIYDRAFRAAGLLD